MEDDKMTEERRTGVSEKRVRVFPRRLRNKEIGDRPDQRGGGDRREGDRRSHKEEKQGYRKPQNSRSAQVFVQLGLAEIFGDTNKVVPAHNDVVHWRVTEGKDSTGELFDRVVDEYTAPH